MKEGLDWIARGIANAATDIRTKIVEEPWFGRAVTAEPASPDISTTGRDRNEDPAAWWRGTTHGQTQGFEPGGQENQPAPGLRHHR